jgi:xylulokinase
MKYLLAHDLGTSGNKATLFTTEGKLVDSVVYAYSTKWFNNNWAEQDAEVWYEAVSESTKKIMKNINADDVVGVSFSGQMMGCLCVNDQGDPLYNSIIWADMRATKEEAFMKEKIPEKEFYRITGHRASASYGLAKLLWIKNNYPKIYDNTYKMLNAKDYIIFKLTGSFVTDYSDASSTNLLDITTLNWSTTIADAVGIDLEKMPKLHKSTDVVGHINALSAMETGLNVGTPIICGGGDGSMSAVGAKCISEGDAFCTLGTSAWNATASKSPVYDDEMRTFNWVHVVPGMFIPCGTMQTAGASISWLKDQLGQLESEECSKNNKSVYEAINKIAEEAEPGSAGLYYLPYLMGERSPRWNPDARGCFLGIKMETTKSDIFRSVYEGVALNLEIILQLVLGKADISQLVMTGGGAKSKIWCQIFADVYNVDILVPNYIEEATSIGAAVTAGVGLGIYDSFDRINDFIKIDSVVHPIEVNVEKYRKMKPIFEHAYTALLPIYEEMAHK